MSLPRILHIAPANTSGVPGQFVQTEQQLGFDSRLVTLFPDPRNYFQDICLNLPFIDFAPTRWIKKIVSDPNKQKIVNRIAKPESIPIQWQPHSLSEKALVKFRDQLWRPKIHQAIRSFQLDDFDVYQLDGGLGFFRHAAFIQEMKNRGKKIICCYTGSDLRTRGVIPHIDAISDCNVTVEFDHLQLHPNITHVCFPFAAEFEPHQHHQNEKPVRIGHAPTNRAAKGSDVIIPIMQKCVEKAHAEMVLIEGMTYHDALAAKQSCDIFVDQIGDLGYGINGLEALAMQIPTASCLAPGFADVYPDHPFINVHAENLEAELLRLVENPQLRIDIGKKGMAWLHKYHDAVAIVKKIHKIAEIDYLKQNPSNKRIL